jgi:folylpolyglutamate synthase
MCECILRNYGLSTGLYTSPHLMDVRERFRVNGENVTEAIFIEAFWEVWNVVQAKMNSEAGLPAPGFFRFLTLVAFHLFKKVRVDVIVLEVGVGGRIDATNIVAAPAVCGITTIDLDHMEVLGDTLEKIAYEKAGICKRGVPVFVTSQQESVLEVFRGCAAAVNAPYCVARPLSHWEKEGQVIKLSLAGSFQSMNAALALELCNAFLETIDRKKYKMTYSIVDEGGGLLPCVLHALATTSWDGRCQTVSLVPGVKTVYVDGAHTPKSISLVGDWFAAEATSAAARVLVFHGGQERKVALLLSKLTFLDFDYIIFVPPSMFRPSKYVAPTASQLLAEVPDQTSVVPVDSADGSTDLSKESTSSSPKSKTNSWSNTLGVVWRCLKKRKSSEEKIIVHGSMRETVGWLRELDGPVNVLLTGSLYIVGDFLTEVRS